MGWCPAEHFISQDLIGQEQLQVIGKECARDFWSFTHVSESCASIGHGAWCPQGE